MSAMSDYLEGQIIDHLFRTGTFAKPPAIYLALFTVAPDDAGGGTEVTGGSYARVAIAQLDANWNPPSAGDGLTDNASDIVFPAPTADWGTIVAFGIFDAATAGNLLIHGTLGTSKTVNNGDPAPRMSAGALNITFA